MIGHAAERTTVFPELEAALRACAQASLLGDERAFQIAYLRFEGETLRVAREAWELRPRAAAARACSIAAAAALLRAAGFRVEKPE